MNKLIILLFAATVLLSCQECLECPSPPEQLRFQLVDGQGRDITVGQRARIDASTVVVNYKQGDKVIDIPLELNQSQPTKTIFELPTVPDLYNSGHNKLLLSIGTLPADTLKPTIHYIESYCCKYVIYSNLLLNADTLKLASDDRFLFQIAK